MLLYRLELKRILSSRVTRIALLVLFLLSVLFAYLPVTFVRYGDVDDAGNEIRYSGFRAIDKIKEAQAEYAGIVTGDTFAKALNAYSSAAEEYGPVSDPDFPLSAYYGSIAPASPLTKMLRETYADPDSGMAQDLTTLTEAQARDFYAQNSRHIRDLMRLEQEEYPLIQAKAIAMYDAVQTPFVFFPGYNTDAVDYLSLYIFVLALGLTALLAPTFSTEYQTGSDTILRCTRYGRNRLALAKLAAAFTVTLVLGIVGIGAHLLLSCTLFGWETVQSSMQILYSCVALPNMSILQMLLAIAAAGMLSLLAVIACTLFLSTLSDTSVLALGLSLGIVVLPGILYVLPSFNVLEWFRTLLPSGGIGLMNSFLYALADFNFLRIGEVGFWSPHVIPIAAAVETPIFILLSVKAYSSRGKR